MEYQLEIYGPGACGSASCIKSVTAAVPFSSIHVGNLLNTKAWEKPVEWPLLRVVNVEHLISETSHGIDPAGRITHRILLYTESVPDAAETRCNLPQKTQS